MRTRPLNARAPNARGTFEARCARRRVRWYSLYVSSQKEKRTYHVAMRLVPLNNYPQVLAINPLADLGLDTGKKVIPNGVQFHIVWNLADGKQARQILGMSVGGSFNATAALAEQARAAITSGANWTAYATYIPTGVSLQAVQLRDLRTADMPLVPSTGAATPGTSASPAMPSEVALCLTLRTAKVGPGNRGRAYFCGFATNAIAAGDVAAAGLMTALNNWAGTISTAMQAIGGTWAVAQPHRLAYTSPITGTHFPERPAAMALTTSGTVRDNHWDSQRRRGLK